MEDDDFEKWILKKSSRKPKKGTYRERVLSGDQLAWNRKKHKPLKSISKKREKEQKLYSKACKEYLKKNPYCELCGREENLSVHHRKGRSGSLLYDKEYFMTLCLIGYALEKELDKKGIKHIGSGTGGCHGLVEANKNLAREMGWILY